MAMNNRFADTPTAKGEPGELHGAMTTGGFIGVQPAWGAP